MNISCRKLKCEYNKKSTCQAKGIKVDSELNCTTYKPVEKKNLPDPTKHMFDIAPEFAPYRSFRNANIKCDANCIFNQNHDCKANGILVNQNSQKERAICFTHTQK